MEYRLTGRFAAVVKTLASFVIIAVFLVGGIAAGRAPYNYLAAPAGLAGLLGLFYGVVSDQQQREQPTHVHATAVLLAGSYVFTAGLSSGADPLVSWGIGGAGLAVVVFVGAWKDYVLEQPQDTEQDFYVRLGESGGEQ